MCIAVSHDGGTRATALAAAAARQAGARVAAITHNATSSVAAAADQVLTTSIHDDSWCHTVAYTSALLAGATIAGALGPVAAQPTAAAELLRHATQRDAAPIAALLAGNRGLLCAGAGRDHITARELALKIAEGARMPTLALELETVLHGQLAGHEPSDALILIAIDDSAHQDRLTRRATHVAQAVAAIGLPVAGILSTAYHHALPPELTPAGRLLIDLPDATLLDHRLAGLLAGAGALQDPALALAHARDTNPDLIRREQAPTATPPKSPNKPRLASAATPLRTPADARHPTRHLLHLVGTFPLAKTGKRAARLSQLVLSMRLDTPSPGVAASSCRCFRRQERARRGARSWQPLWTSWERRRRGQRTRAPPVNSSDCADRSHA